MSREIVFYGEKGILNSIVLDIQGDIAKQKQFIRSIILADKSKLSWVDSVHTVKCFMAPSLDQFGDPDMIMEAVTTDGEKYVLFIVTTTATYQNSALIMNQLEEKDNQYLPKTYITHGHFIPASVIRLRVIPKIPLTTKTLLYLGFTSIKFKAYCAASNSDRFLLISSL